MITASIKLQRYLDLGNALQLQHHDSRRDHKVRRRAQRLYTTSYAISLHLIGSVNTGPLAASREAMSEARLPLAYRDSCANLLIPLNRCRREEYYLPWKCEVCLAHEAWLLLWSQSTLKSAHSTARYKADSQLQTERHSYEKCQYDEFKKRVAKMDELRAAKGGQRSNW